jgi:uncharacterized protein
MKNTFQRSHFEILKKRIKEPRRFIQVLVGPRQVGKTTLALQLVESLGIPYHFAAADGVPAGESPWLEQQWNLARLTQQQQGSDFLLVIDEVQKIGRWSEIVKKCWDEDTRKGTPIKILLLGSSRLLLQQGLTESLAGRFELIHLGHWTFPEMQAAFGFSLQQYIWFGGYPGAASLIEEEDRWKRYVREALIETSISKDILMLTRVDKPALMKQLFELGCHFSGQILSFNKMLGQLLDAGNTVTLAHYLNLLDTANLLGGLEKYSPNLIRKRSSSPKFMVYNTALISAHSQVYFSEAVLRPNEWGRIAESAIGAHLLNCLPDDTYKLYYWNHAESEIDFVLEKNGQVIGLEVKSGKVQHSPSIGAFQKAFPDAKMLLIGESGIPIEAFLSMKPEQVFSI